MSRALRLTFEYRDGEVELVASEPVDAIVPGVAGEPTAEPPHGFRLDLLDERGARLHSRRLHDPMPQHAEFLLGEPDRPFTNQPIPEPSGRFFVLVPALEEAAEAALFHSDGKRGAKRARPLARFELPRDGERKSKS